MKRALAVSFASHLLVVSFVLRSYHDKPPEWWNGQPPRELTWVSDESSSSPVQTLAPKRGRAKFVRVAPDVVEPVYQTSERSTGGHEVAKADLGEAEVSIDQFTRWGNRPPVYPRLAVERGWEGSLKLKLVFEKEIPVVILLESSGYDLLDEAALRAAEGWRLPPDQTATAAYVVPIQFKIQE